MEQGLLERGAELEVLLGAVGDAEAGRGSTALVTGEAGIGKTSLVRAFSHRLEGRARVLLTACDDLITPRTLGPLRDAAAESRGPLATALAQEGPVDSVFAGLLEELALKRPTVLVVEDVHWADDATLDVLGYAARRLEILAAVMVLTFRDDALGPVHPLRRLLGTLAGCRVHRLGLAPLSPDAVGRLSAGTGRNAWALHALTRGNPFFLSEALATEPREVPATVMEAVLARVRRLAPDCREALEQLSVVPGQVSGELAASLLGAREAALAEAEIAGVIEVGPSGLGFRHELARRAIEASLPGIRRRLLNRAVVEALRAQAQPERARLVHHAVEAGDIETVLAVGPAAARDASRSGSQRQALAHYESVLPHVARLPPRERAEVLDDYGWELYNAHRFADAVRAGREAARLYAGLDDPTAVGLCLVRLSRHLFMAGETDEAQAAAEQAVELLEPSGQEEALAHACLYLGAILTLTDPEPAGPVLERAQRLAIRSGRGDLATLCLNYLGIARVESGEPDGLQQVEASIAAARAGGHYEYAARGYTNLGELLLRDGRLEDLDECIRDGLAFTRERGFWSHAYNLEVHRCVLLARRGDPQAAERGLSELVASVEDPGMLYAYSVPWLARLLARRGDDAAEAMLAEAWDRARGQRLLIGLAYAGIAYVEWAWLAEDPETARAVGEELLGHFEHPGAAPFRGELLRYMARAGLPAEPFPGCPAGYDAGLRGDWRGAAEAWEAAEDPYETALELAESGEVEATLEAVRRLDELGAVPAANRARRRLRELGARVPRGPRSATRTNPAGLTERQLAVLALLREGLTNAEIAERLVVSVRTVDHHVAAVLDKLDVKSRREAVSAAEEWTRAKRAPAGPPAVEPSRRTG